MNLKTKHLIAMLRVTHLRKELLEEPITELDCRNFEELDEKKKEIITAQVMYVMNHGYANHLATYSNPIEQYIDPIKIYGEKGIYLVSEIESENYTFFTNKKEAYTYANEAYDNWLEIYGDMD
jgi:hypothetical protein